MDILTVAEMRALERAADAAGLSYAQMMHNAGAGVARAILARLVDPGTGSIGARVVILVGPGNNGGDGLVCAAELARAGVRAEAYLLRARGSEDPVFAEARAAGVAVAHAADDPDRRRLQHALENCDVAVDAVLGTGVARPIDGALQDILATLARARPRLVVALDGPTGMDYDTGALDPTAVPADLTLTFHAHKRGHLCYPAAAACGAIEVIDIGIGEISPALRGEGYGPSIQLADHALARALLPRRAADGNKGTHGKALIVAGCADYRGAPTLAARAAYRTGAGLVAYAVPQAAATVAAIACPEATFVPLPESVEVHAPASVRRLSAWLAGAGGAAVAVGPGLGTAADTAAFLDALWDIMATGERRIAGLVCDADALNLLAAREGWPRRLPASSVLTPHPGEMARLAGSTVAAIQSDRIGNALRFSAEWSHVVLLKGAHTVIAAPDGRGVVLPFANPAMAVAGMGDVLTGCIAALLAQGLTPFDAAVAGGFVHGTAGQLWLERHGDAGLLAGDVIDLLPDALGAIKRPLTGRS